MLIIVFLPGLNLHILEVEGRGGFDECLCQAGVGHEGYVVVDGSAAYAVAVG